jgi:hypothetical protein
VPAQPEAYRDALDRAREHAAAWLESLPTRHVGPSADAETLVRRLGTALPVDGTDPADVVDELAAAA